MGNNFTELLYKLKRNLQGAFRFYNYEEERSIIQDAGYVSFYFDTISKRTIDDINSVCHSEGLNYTITHTVFKGESFIKITITKYIA